MSDDDLLDDVLTESGAADVGASSVESPGAADLTAPRVPAPEIIKTTEDVVRILAERGEEMVGLPANLPPARASSPRSAKVSRKKVVEKGDGRCGAYAPRGTKCKLCGKVHP